MRPTSLLAFAVLVSLALVAAQEQDNALTELQLLRTRVTMLERDAVLSGAVLNKHVTRVVAAIHALQSRGATHPAFTTLLRPIQAAVASVDDTCQPWLQCAAPNPSPFLRDPVDEAEAAEEVDANLRSSPREFLKAAFRAHKCIALHWDEVSSKCQSHVFQLARAVRSVDKKDLVVEMGVTELKHLQVMGSCDEDFARECDIGVPRATPSPPAIDDASVVNPEASEDTGEAAGAVGSADGSSATLVPETGTDGLQQEDTDGDLPLGSARALLGHHRKRTRHSKKAKRKHKHMKTKDRHQRRGERKSAPGLVIAKTREEVERMKHAERNLGEHDGHRHGKHRHEHRHGHHRVGHGHHHGHRRSLDHDHHMRGPDGHSGEPMMARYKKFHSKKHSHHFGSKDAKHSHDRFPSLGLMHRGRLATCIRRSFPSFSPVCQQALSVAKSSLQSDPSVTSLFKTKHFGATKLQDEDDDDDDNDDDCMDWDWEDGHHPHMFLLVPLFVALLGCCFARKARRRCRRQRMMRDGVLVEEDRGRCCRRRCSRRRVDSGADYPGATPAPPARGMVIGQPVQLVNPPAESENPEEVAYFPSAPGNDTQRLVAH